MRIGLEGHSHLYPPITIRLRVASLSMLPSGMRWSFLCHRLQQKKPIDLPQRAARVTLTGDVEDTGCFQAAAARTALVH